jgi:hypothetical protein
MPLLISRRPDITLFPLGCELFPNSRPAKRKRERKGDGQASRAASRELEFECDVNCDVKAEFIRTHERTRIQIARIIPDKSPLCTPLGDVSMEIHFSRDYRYFDEP